MRASGFGGALGFGGGVDLAAEFIDFGFEDVAFCGGGGGVFGEGGFFLFEGGDGLPCFGDFLAGGASGLADLFGEVGDGVLEGGFERGEFLFGGGEGFFCDGEGGGLFLGEGGGFGGGGLGGGDEFLEFRGGDGGGGLFFGEFGVLFGEFAFEGGDTGGGQGGVGAGYFGGEVGFGDGGFGVASGGVSGREPEAGDGGDGEAGDGWERLDGEGDLLWLLMSGLGDGVGRGVAHFDGFDAIWFRPDGELATGEFELRG